MGSHTVDTAYMEITSLSLSRNTTQVAPATPATPAPNIGLSGSWYFVKCVGAYKQTCKTRKLCYRKDDRAMCPTYGCPENFRYSLTAPTATIHNIFMGYCSDRPYECSYKI